MPYGGRASPVRWTPMSAPASQAAPARRRIAGAGMVLVIVYAILAFAATGRSVFQILRHFQDAPIAYAVSAVAAVVYIVATLALFLRKDRLAWATIGFELFGVLLVGTLSLFLPDVFGRPFGGEGTVWSWYGAGYVFIPLALPVLGLLWLRRTTRRQGSAAERSAEQPSEGA